MKKTGRLKQLLALILAGALTVGSVGTPVFGADFGDTVVESAVEEETLDEGVSEEAAEEESGAGAASEDMDVSEGSNVETYTVTLDANGGYFENEWDDTVGDYVERAVTVTRQIPVGGTVSNIVPLMEQENAVATFLGWSLEPDGEVVSLAEEEYIPVENCVLYAVWQIEGREEIEDSETALPETNAEESVQDETQEDVQDEAQEENPTEFTAEGATAQEEYSQEPFIEEETAQEEDSLEQVVEEETTQEEDSLYSEDSQESEESSGTDEGSEVTDGDSQDNEALETDEGVEEVSSDIPHDTGIDDETATGEQADTTGKEQSISTGGEIETDKASETISTAPLNGQAESVTYSSGNCGNGVTYVLEYKDDTLEDGMLTISGSGAMSDYRITDTSASDKFPYTSAPWSNSNVFQIASVNVNNGVTHIGNYAFCGAGGVTAAEISGSVKTIGAGSFWGCASLTDMVIPEGVDSIGTSAFYYCANMKSITLPASIAAIDKSAFYLCSKLTDVYYGGTEDDWNSLVENGIESYRNENLLNAQIHFAEGTKVTFWEDMTESGDVQNRIDSFTWSSSNYSWNRADGTDKYDSVCMKVEWTAETEEERDANAVTIDLPEGFSFKEDEMVATKDFPYNGESLAVKVYPIFNEDSEQKALSVHLVFYHGSKTLIRAEKTVESTRVIINENSGKIWVSDTKYDYAPLDPDWYKNSSYNYNHSMAKLSAALSAMEYLSEDRIRSSYRNLGFSDVAVFERETVDGEWKDTVNCSIARKKVILDGKVVTILAVPMRGTTAHNLKDLVEWLSNFDFSGNVTDHEGFLMAKEVVASLLTTYLDHRNISVTDTDETKLLLCGHSRAAATANLLAADYDDSLTWTGSGSSETKRPTNVYCYTFATPNCTKRSDSSNTKYNNIFNYVYTTDVVPSMAPRWMGFKKYGITCVLPDPYGTRNYASKYKPAIKETYLSYTGSEYDPVTFEDYALALVGIEKDFIPDDPNGCIKRAGKVARTCGKKLCLALDIINSIGNLFPKILCAHDMLGYLSWIENTSGFADLSNKEANYKVVRVACPVDVEVRDSSGELVGKVSSETVDPSYTGIYAMAIEGVKYLFLPCSDTYQLTITATDSGEMAYSVFEYDSDGLVSRSVNAYGIELEAGKTFQTSVSGVLGTDKKNYQIRTSDNKTIIPELEIDETQYQDTEDVEALIPGMLEAMGEASGETGGNTAEIVATGGAGDNATWTLDADGVMTFSGYGRLSDYSWGWDIYGYESTNIPWTQWKDGGYSQDYHGTTDYRSSIKKVVIEPGITYIGDYTFIWCNNLKSVEIPDSVTGIGNDVFYGDNTCKNINIPPDLTQLGEEAFIGCGISGTLVIPEKITTIPKGAFSGCSNLTQIVLHKGITDIGDDAFARCTSIKAFSIPDSVTNLGTGVISGCTSLSKLEIGNGLTKIPDGAFYDLKKLMDIQLHEGITSVGKQAFYNNSSLIKIVLPDSIESIGDYAFSSCTSLSQITFGTGLKTIGDGAFERTGIYEPVLPDGLKSIGWRAFSECTRLNKILIPDSVTNLGEGIFYSCTSLKYVKFGDGIKTIPKETFGCNAYGGVNGIETVVLGKNVKTIEKWAFVDCWQLKTIQFPSSLVTIEANAFDECKSLQEIFLPDSVTEIGKSAFSSCSGLKKVELSNNLERIEDYVFLGCDLQEIVIPDSVKTIGDGAFIGNQNLNNVILPNYLESLGVSCFHGCESLEGINLPGSIDTIPKGAFSGCKNLKAIQIPDSVQFIDDDAFEVCYALESVTLGKGLMQIGSKAFGGCNHLQEITIPENVSSILQEAFYYCYEMKSITFLGNAPSIGDNCFNGDTMYAFYPADDSTWSSWVMENYGGNITWHTICDPHTPNDAVIENKTDATCEEDGYQEVVTYCSSCGFELSRENVVLPKTGHRWDKGTVYYEPTLYDEGEMEYHCLNCGTYKWESIPKIKPKSITTATVSGISNKTYTGSAIKQSVTVQLGSKTLESSTDYTVSYKNNTNVGTATLVIKGKEYYTGTITKTFKINKANQSITAKSSASSVAVGKTATISISGAKGTKSYKSSNTAIATVTSTGKLTAKKVGTVKITATCAATSNFNAASRTVTIKVVPAATASISSANQAKGINLVWKKVTGATGYLVYRGSTKIATIKSGSTVTYTDSKANTNGTKYTYKIIPTASTGNGPAKSVTAYCVARPAISSMTNSASKRMTVKWGKNAKASGYQIHYCTDKTFKTGNKSVSVTSAATVSKAIDSLTKGKTYYVRIRTYKTVGSRKYFSAWSPVKSVKISK